MFCCSASGISRRLIFLSLQISLRAILKSCLVITSLPTSAAISSADIVSGLKIGLRASEIGLCKDVRTIWASRCEESRRVVGEVVAEAGEAGSAASVVRGWPDAGVNSGMGIWATLVVLAGRLSVVGGPGSVAGGPRSGGGPAGAPAGGATGSSGGAGLATAGDAADEGAVAGEAGLAAGSLSGGSGGSSGIRSGLGPRRGSPRCASSPRPSLPAPKFLVPGKPMG